MIKLEPCDVLLYVNEGTNWVSAFSRWAIGRYEHVSTYMGTAFLNTPFIYQSEGRGALIDSLQEHTNRLVTVMRADPAQITQAQKDQVIAEAIEIVSGPGSYYDYVAIVKFCVPYILKKKFPWLPINPPEYKRDRYMICSEAAAEAWWRAGISILPTDVIPLPGDFLTSLALDIVGEGRILVDVVP